MNGVNNNSGQEVHPLLQRNVRKTGKDESRSENMNTGSSNVDQNGHIEGRHSRQAFKRWTKSSILHGIFDQVECANFELLLITRIAALITWTGAILYSTYQVFRACEEMLTWNSDPIMNPSFFSRILNRGKDNTDFEWELFIHLYSTRLLLWFGVYLTVSKIVQLKMPENWRFISPAVSFIMFWELLGFLPSIFLLLQPMIYWSLAQTRSKLLIWIATVLFIYNLNTPIIKTFIPTNSMSEYFFVLTAAWNYARCISFCYDVWEKMGDNDKYIGFNFLENAVHYCFYLPLAISGPLVTYESFERHILNKDFEVLKKENLLQNVFNLFKKLFRLGLIALMCELLLHFLYFRSLSMTTSTHRYLNLWAICGTVYWLGQFFSMKYKVLYGVSTAIAEFDGMEMPPLPKCPSYLHRYSVLWREFDPGLHRFLVNYIYLPSLKYLKELDESNIVRIPSDFQKLIASFASFVYVYLWHSLAFDVFLWTALNFLGITIERIGSVIKREVDKRVVIEPIAWDFIVEPIVTIPLAAMSILNSSIFCGSLQTTVSFSTIIWSRWGDSYVFTFLYCFTHTAVAYRTWRLKLHLLFSKIKNNF